MKNKGFTLTELLITLSILAILLASALPDFRIAIQKAKLQTASRSLVESIEAARSKAVFAKFRTVIHANPDWASGWSTFVDMNDNGILDADEFLLMENEKLSGVRIKDNFPTPNQISFISTGESRKPGRRNSGAFIAGNIQICPEKHGEGIKLVLNRAGRLRADKLTAEECSRI